MSQFRNWYVRNQDAITWFIIGFLSMSLINSLANGNWIWAAVESLIIYANYKVRNFRMQ